MDTRAKILQQEHQSSNKQVLLVGSSHDCQIVIRDASISPHHMTITRINKEQYKIEDIGSKDGTYVKGQKISSQVVNRQDIIQIGSRPVEIRWLVSHFGSEVPEQLAAFAVHPCWSGRVRMWISFCLIRYFTRPHELMVEQSGNVLIADKGSARALLNGIQVHSNAVDCVRKFGFLSCPKTYAGRLVGENPLAVV